MDPVDPILALRPFVPARDFDLSRRYYEALGFATTHRDDSIAMLKLGSFSFILQNFYVKEVAENCMLQILVRDVDAWWSRVLRGSSTLSASSLPRPPRCRVGA